METPVIVVVTVSVAVTVWVPSVFNVTWNTPTPFVSVEFAGSTAAASVLVKCTVPVYVVTGLLNWSTASTTRLNAVPADTEGDPATTKCVTTPELTRFGFEVPVIVAVTVSVAVTVWLPTVLNVTGKVPAPLVRVVFAGKIADASELVKCTVPV